MQTLNALIRRIQTLALAHKQIRSFRTGPLETDFFTDKTAKYPSCCLQYNAGEISTAGNYVLVNFGMFLLDMVHVSEDTKTNQDDVLSDMLSILRDLVSEMNNGNFNDWFLSADNTLQAVVEHENDLVAGWVMTFSIRMIYRENVCEIPSDVFDFPDGQEGGGSSVSADKSLFDVIYIADGTEGSTITIPEMVGKKVMSLATRENNPIYKVSNNPDEAEFTWNNAVIGLGVPVVNVGERFLFLYRNY